MQLSAESAKHIETVDERFQSFNVEMVEVTGGSFWAPYGTDSGVFRYREPLDLSNEKLRNLARELAPAFVRVSGSWANGTYYDFAETAGEAPPEGFLGVLRKSQWDAVGDFANDLGLDIITSFAISDGTRDSTGKWTSDHALKLIEYSQQMSYPLVAAEFFNEPSFAFQGVPRGYDAAQFARDFRVFKNMVEESAPWLQIVGPGVIGEIMPKMPKLSFQSEEVLREISPAFDAFSYHFYPTVSKRCAPAGSPEDVLQLEFLSRVIANAEHYEALRDTFEPGVPVWITETGEASCGGNPWAAKYVDLLRYLDQMGQLAARGTQIVMHNTLSASDYALIDETDFSPRPAYWGAVLWQRLMGAKVLDLELVINDKDLRIYAHCQQKGVNGSVSYLLINLSQTQSKAVGIAKNVSLYQLTGENLEGDQIWLNGSLLEAGQDGVVGDLAPANLSAGLLEMPPVSVTFAVDEAANVSACR